MKEQLVTLETAKLAKEKGFDWKCDNYFQDVGYSPRYYDPDEVEPFYDDHNSIALEISAPTQSVLQKWLRDVHGISVLVQLDMTASWEYDIRSLHERSSYQGQPIMAEYVYNTYEEAFEVGLLEALKLIEND